jgi:hypothetical protein
MGPSALGGVVGVLQTFVTWRAASRSANVGWEADISEFRMASPGKEGPVANPALVAIL